MPLSRQLSSFAVLHPNCTYLAPSFFFLISQSFQPLNHPCCPTLTSLQLEAFQCCWGAQKQIKSPVTSTQGGGWQRKPCLWENPYSHLCHGTETGFWCYPWDLAGEKLPTSFKYSIESRHWEQLRSDVLLRYFHSFHCNLLWRCWKDTRRKGWPKERQR